MEYAYSSILWSTSHKNMLILRNSVSAIRIHTSLYIHVPCYERDWGVALSNPRVSSTRASDLTVPS